MRRRNVDPLLRRFERRAAAEPTLENLELLNRARLRAGLPGYEELTWVNAWVRGVPQASLKVEEFAQWIEVEQFLKRLYGSIYRTEPRVVFDVFTGQQAVDPPPELVIRNEDEPAFDFRAEATLDYEGESRQHRRIFPRHEGYVSLQLVEELPVRPQPLLPATLPADEIMAWVNAYEIHRVYGGPQEGGWYYNRAYPLACVYVGIVRCSVGDWVPLASTPQAEETLAFVSKLYEDVAHGDIYSVLGGTGLHTALENQRAEDSGPEWYE